MTCKRCRISMKPQRGSHHKQRKHVCPRCGRAQMERNRDLR